MGVLSLPREQLLTETLWKQAYGWYTTIPVPTHARTTRSGAGNMDSKCFFDE